MRFTAQPPPPDEPDDPAVMHIGGPAGRVRAAAGYVAGVAAVAAVLVGGFVWFGATVGWAVVLVGLMLGYMAAMAKWASGDP
jgi:hypothetical protein